MTVQSELSKMAEEIRGVLAPNWPTLSTHKIESVLGVIHRKKMGHLIDDLKEESEVSTRAKLAWVHQYVKDAFHRIGVRAQELSKIRCNALEVIQAIELNYLNQDDLPILYLSCVKFRNSYENCGTGYYKLWTHEIKRIEPLFNRYTRVSFYRQKFKGDNFGKFIRALGMIPRSAEVVMDSYVHDRNWYQAEKLICKYWDGVSEYPRLNLSIKDDSDGKPVVTVTGCANFKATWATITKYRHEGVA